jgi:hypothetical protein
MESKYKVRVGYHGESKKCYGLLVDVIIDPKTQDYSASRLEWFPKSLCEVEKKEIPGHVPAYFLTAPEWLLKNKNVNYVK